MNPSDFRRLVGVDQVDSDYLPVACLLTSGYGCVGFYNDRLNSELEDTCVLLNARLVKLSGSDKTRAAIGDFNSFIEEIVLRDTDRSDGPRIPDHDDMLGTSIPLTAVPFAQIALVYPISQIAALLKRAEKSDVGVPTFLDFDNKSVVLKLLRTKLW
jgi:hypothetical protein